MENTSLINRIQRELNALGKMIQASIQKSPHLFIIFILLIAGLFCRKLPTASEDHARLSYLIDSSQDDPVEVRFSFNELGDVHRVDVGDIAVLEIPRDLPFWIFFSILIITMLEMISILKVRKRKTIRALVILLFFFSILLVITVNQGDNFHLYFGSGLIAFWVLTFITISVRRDYRIKFQAEPKAKT